jgi:hypothetical protein
MPSLGSQAVTTAITNTGPTAITGLGKVRALSLVAAATVTGGGTTLKGYIQTSLDGGVTWYDIAQFAFTTASAVKGKNLDGSAQIATATLTAGTMADDTVQHGLIGDALRFVVTSTGTYSAGSKLDVYYQAR